MTVSPGLTKSVYAYNLILLSLGLISIVATNMQTFLSDNFYR